LYLYPAAAPVRHYKKYRHIANASPCSSNLQKSHIHKKKRHLFGWRFGSANAWLSKLCRSGFLSQHQHFFHHHFGDVFLLPVFVGIAAVYPFSSSQDSTMQM
jgi:hypothetical protein